MSYDFYKNGVPFLNSINADNFDANALAVFRHQYQHNTLYHQFCNTIHRRPDAVHSITDIPFLPISFFKTHVVKTGDWEQTDLVFESSGTTGNVPNRHYVHDQQVYLDALLVGFKQFYGNPEDYIILALLPSYLERGNSSLVHMVKTLMDIGGNEASGFYLDEWAQLHKVLEAHKNTTAPRILLIGVTFALLDFAEAYPGNYPDVIVMETGGMKGRKEELTRQDVHDLLKKQWQLKEVHSEYGMTELLSQAYAVKDGVFEPAATMKVLVRDINDPLDVAAEGVGGINVIDLANVHSCSFIATEDIARLHGNGSFEVLGRMDYSALRGCNLMVI